MSLKYSKDLPAMPLGSVVVNKPKLPYISPELQLMVIELATEDSLPEAWFAFRLVSKGWKSEIERVFQQKYLSLTTITFYYSRNPFYTLVFDRLSQDGSKAVFKMSDRAMARTKIYHIDVPKTSSQAIFGTDFFLVTIEGVACSDPKLDGVDLDPTQDTISIPWIPVVNQVLGDEVRLRQRAAKICDEGLESGEPQELDSLRKLPRLQLGQGWKTDKNKRGMLLYLISHSQSFKTEIETVRESRIKRQYKLSQNHFTPSSNGLANRAEKVSQVDDVRAFDYRCQP
ncbi:hypothetical protein F4814DRAFT_456688 [Daldinia grandis]|nr:hypothetical protein F4814DRAFT_456688 [Daldinia grandis]